MSTTRQPPVPPTPPADTQYAAGPRHPLSPTARTTLNRSRNRAGRNRALLWEILDEATICHLGFATPSHPVVLPTVFAGDPDGPDEAGTLYLHGSVATRSLSDTPGTDLCVTITLVDGLVLARSAFNHSMNYRSAVIIGAARRVSDEAERAHALDLIVDHVVPGRSAHLRPNTRKELAATAVLALPLAEASVKHRAGDPGDEEEDIDGVTWAGVIDFGRTATVRTAADAPGVDVPDHVRAHVARLHRP